MLPSAGMLTRRTILGTGLVAGAAGLPAVAAAYAPASEFGIEPNAASDQSAALQRAIDALGGRGLVLPPGLYVAGDLKIRAPIAIAGTPGLTRIAAASGSALDIRDAASVTLSGLVLDGVASVPVADAPALLSATQVRDLAIEGCVVRNGSGSGIALRRCTGSVRATTVAQCGDAGLFALDCQGLEIVHNHVHDIADNGIQVWQSEKREDGAIIAFNRVERIGARSGGNGPYGNAINVYRGGNVMIAHNRASDCVFSAVRVHSGSNVQVTGNNCSRLDETAIYVEFGFEGAVVSGNIVEGAGKGISITNFDHGGRLAVCANNVVRDMHGARSNAQTRALGIAVEADTAVTGNVVENAPFAGLWLGWGYAMRNISATGNIIRDCGIGIAASVAERAERGIIANNLISGSKTAAILGMNYEQAATGDLALPGAKAPGTLMVSGNLVT